MPLPDHEAVRVLKPGVLRPVYLIGKCRACGCIIEVPKDRAKYESGDRPGEFGAHTYPCQTPRCTESVWLGDSATTRREAEEHACQTAVR